jgi:hypothetical protein
MADKNEKEIKALLKELAGVEDRKSGKARAIRKRLRDLGYSLREANAPEKSEKKSKKSETKSSKKKAKEEEEEEEEDEDEDEDE